MSLDKATMLLYTIMPHLHDELNLAPATVKRTQLPAWATELPSVDDEGAYELMELALTHAELHDKQNHRREAEDFYYLALALALSLSDSPTPQDSAKVFEIKRRLAGRFESCGRPEQASSLLADMQDQERSSYNKARERIRRSIDESHLHPEISQEQKARELKEKMDKLFLQRCREADVIMDKSMQLHKQKQFIQAANGFRKAYRIYSSCNQCFNSSAALFNLACALYDLGELATSLKACTAAFLHLHPELKVEQESHEGDARIRITYPDAHPEALAAATGAGSLQELDNLEAGIRLHIANCLEEVNPPEAVIVYSSALRFYYRLGNFTQMWKIMHRAGWLGLQTHHFKQSLNILLSAFCHKVGSDYATSLARYHFLSGEAWRSMGRYDIAAIHYAKGSQVGPIGTQDLLDLCHFGMYLCNSQEANLSEAMKREYSQDDPKRFLAEFHTYRFIKGEGFNLAPYLLEDSNDALPGSTTVSPNFELKKTKDIVQDLVYCLHEIRLETLRTDHPQTLERQGYRTKGEQQLARQMRLTLQNLEKLRHFDLDQGN